MNSENIPLESIVVQDRVRKDLGDIDELCDSIREVGLIQPIVLTRDNRLVAGERRFRALQRLGIKELLHAKTFIYNDEQDQLRLQAMEIEENVRRKQLTWQEEVLAKKRLLETLQAIHGVARPGYPSRSDVLGITSPGFGVNKLSSLLGESNAQTSKDIELAKLIESVPSLAKAETKEAARRQAQLAVTVAIALQQQKASPPKTDQKWTLYEGDFNDNAGTIESNSVDVVICDPPYGEDTQGMGPNSKQLIATSFADSKNETVLLVGELVAQAHRVLRENSFGAIFFGHTIYSELVESARFVNFEVDVSPLIWVKNTVVNTSPYTRYGRSYEAILILRKGSPKLFRPAQRDVFELANVITRGTNEQKLYQAQKPVALIEKLLLDLCPPGGTVVDFCAGSGTTGEAALRTGRRVILFEKDPVACQIIRARLGALP